MHIGAYEFGRITIDGVTYDHDVVVEGKKISKRKKGPSKARKGEFGHTPLTAAEKIPWNVRRLWIGTGCYGSLPVAEDVRAEAARRGVELRCETTPEIVNRVNDGLPAKTALILHLTC
jgi:hypothetical protein